MTRSTKEAHAVISNVVLPWLQGHPISRICTYMHFVIASEDKKKCIEIPAACELLNLVLGLQLRPQVDKLNNYLMYQNDYKVITMDQWMGFIRFCNDLTF
ncbi:Defective in cullin neddylation protein [Zea mays]|uniref:Defective in cullin neddylation protein n=1 Tax=Zea mays TaxID=4577 RepID=A0A1D6IA29_MAIZE|nr:Defective in cullin neddylation protein [Zea mays]